MSNSRTYLLLFIGFILLGITLVIFNWGGQLNIETEVYMEWFQFAVSLVAGISIIQLSRSIGMGVRQSRTWLTVGIGFILWSMGMLYWAFAETIIHDEPPFPGIQDIGFVLMYILIITAFFFQLRSYSRVIKPTPGLVVGLLSLAGLYFWIAWSDVSSNSGLSLALHVFYLLAAITVVSGSLVMWHLTRGVPISKAWLLLAVSLFMIIIGIEVFHMLEHLKLYRLGYWHWIDMSIIIGFMVAWIGSNILRWSFDKVNKLD